MNEHHLTPPVVIRGMNPRELSDVRAMAVAAFGGDKSIGELLDALSTSWSWEDDLSFVAEREGDIIGQALFSKALLDAPRHLVNVLVLGPVAVRPDVQLTGVGERLITESLTSIAHRPEPVVFVEGHPNYYPRFGFERAVDLGFQAPSERIPDEAFMVYRLPEYEAWMTGRLVYPDAFWRTDSVGLR